uniref:Uncharacterized protein n=1 Tax=Arundo donax TaxID=35708 RepID=A0A0A9T202_ARUDO
MNDSVQSSPSPQLSMLIIINLLINVLSFFKSHCFRPFSNLNLGPSWQNPLASMFYRNVI